MTKNKSNIIPFVTKTRKPAEFFYWKCDIIALPTPPVKELMDAVFKSNINSLIVLNHLRNILESEGNP